MLGPLMRSIRVKVGKRLPGLWKAESHDAGTGSANDANGLLDLVALVVGEFIDLRLDAGDQPTDSGDLVIRWHRLCSGPILGCSEGVAQSFAAAQRIRQISLQVRQVGDIGGEV